MLLREPIIHQETFRTRKDVPVGKQVKLISRYIKQYLSLQGWLGKENVTCHFLRRYEIGKFNYIEYRFIEH